MTDTSVPRLADVNDQRQALQQVTGTEPRVRAGGCTKCSWCFGEHHLSIAAALLSSSPAYRGGDRGLRKVTKLKTDCKWDCKSIEEEWLLSQELPGRIINEKTEDVQKKKRSILEKSQRLREGYRVMKI